MKKGTLSAILGLSILVSAAGASAQTNLTVIRRSDSTLWSQRCEGVGPTACDAWERISGKLASQPTLTWDSSIGKYIIIGSAGGKVWKATFNADGSFNGDWKEVKGVKEPSKVTIAARGSDDSANFWRLDGNDVDPLGTSFFGTTNNLPLQLKVNGDGVLRFDAYDATATASSPNIVAGFNAIGDRALGNGVAAGVVGAVVGGGGQRVDGVDDLGNPITVDEFNIVTDNFGTIGGGANNRVGSDDENPGNSSYATVAGGYRNTASGNRSVIGGGLGNYVLGYDSTIGGGSENQVLANNAVIAGGDRNVAVKRHASIVGGLMNLAGGMRSTIAGGSSNWATGNRSVIGGGSSNTAGEFPHADLDPDLDGVKDYTLIDDLIGSNATVSGGELNVASGNHSSIPGGKMNTATGAYGFAAGHLAKAWTNGSFAWADDSVGTNTYAFPPEDPGNAGNPIAEVADNQFWVRATGGFFFVTAIDAATGVPTAGMKLDAGGAGWTDMAIPSDRNIKTNFAPADTRGILEKVAALPIQSWSYRGKGEAAGSKHLGPTAQDFRASFGLGDDDRHIAPVDASGVSLAAIQGLYGLVKELQTTVAGLEAKLVAQREESTALRNQIADLSAQYGRLRRLIAAAPEFAPILSQR